MDTVFMNSENSKTSDIYKLVFTCVGKIHFCVYYT